MRSLLLPFEMVYPFHTPTNVCGDMINRNEVIKSIKIMAKIECDRCDANITQDYCKTCWIPFMIDFLQNFNTHD